MATEVTIEVGDKNYVIDTAIIPPVGATVVAHKHLYDGGTYPTLEIVDHEWRLEEPAEIDGNPVLAIRIRTRVRNK